jgi:hypothetical protein
MVSKLAGETFIDLYSNADGNLKSGQRLFESKPPSSSNTITDGVMMVGFTARDTSKTKALGLKLCRRSVIAFKE